MSELTILLTQFRELQTQLTAAYTKTPSTPEANLVAHGDHIKELHGKYARTTALLHAALDERDVSRREHGKYVIDDNTNDTSDDTIGQ